jgi:hypothetical protein
MMKAKTGDDFRNSCHADGSRDTISNSGNGLFGQLFRRYINHRHGGLVFVDSQWRRCVYSSGN